MKSEAETRTHIARRRAALELRQQSVRLIEQL